MYIPTQYSHLSAAENFTQTNSASDFAINFQLAFTLRLAFASPNHHESAEPLVTDQIIIGGR
jgi:hypothetical protein